MLLHLCARGQNYNYHLPNCPQERGRRVVGEGTRKRPSILVEAFQNEESLTKVNNQQSNFWEFWRYSKRELPPLYCPEKWGRLGDAGVLVLWFEILYLFSCGVSDIQEWGMITWFLWPQASDITTETSLKPKNQYCSMWLYFLYRRPVQLHIWLHRQQRWCECPSPKKWLRVRWVDGLVGGEAAGRRVVLGDERFAIESRDGKWCPGRLLPTTAYTLL